jgi:hypothetical protein
MTDEQKLEYIYATLKEYRELLPTSENVVLDKNDPCLHQQGARTIIAMQYIDELILHAINTEFVR